MFGVAAGNCCPCPLCNPGCETPAQLEVLAAGFVNAFCSRCTDLNTSHFVDWLLAYDHAGTPACSWYDNWSWNRCPGSFYTLLTAAAKVWLFDLDTELEVEAAIHVGSLSELHPARDNHSGGSNPWITYHFLTTVAKSTFSCSSLDGLELPFYRCDAGTSVGEARCNLYCDPIYASATLYLPP
jgi:hypothetical protein